MMSHLRCRLLGALSLALLLGLSISSSQGQQPQSGVLTRKAFGPYANKRAFGPNSRRLIGPVVAPQNTQEFEPTPLPPVRPEIALRLFDIRARSKSLWLAQQIAASKRAGHSIPLFSYGSYRWGGQREPWEVRVAAYYNALMGSGGGVGFGWDLPTDGRRPPSRPGASSYVAWRLGGGGTGRTWGGAWGSGAEPETIPGYVETPTDWSGHWPQDIGKVARARPRSGRDQLRPGWTGVGPPVIHVGAAPDDRWDEAADRTSARWDRPLPHESPRWRGVTTSGKPLPPRIVSGYGRDVGGGWMGDTHWPETFASRDFEGQSGAVPRAFASTGGWNRRGWQEGFAGFAGESLLPTTASSFSPWLEQFPAVATTLPSWGGWSGAAGGYGGRGWGGGAGGIGLASAAEPLLDTWWGDLDLFGTPFGTPAWAPGRWGGGFGGVVGEAYWPLAAAHRGRGVGMLDPFALAGAGFPWWDETGWNEGMGGFAGTGSGGRRAGRGDAGGGWDLPGVSVARGWGGRSSWETAMPPLALADWLTIPEDFWEGEDAGFPSRAQYAASRYVKDEIAQQGFRGEAGGLAEAYRDDWAEDFDENRRRALAETHQVRSLAGERREAATGEAGPTVRHARRTGTRRAGDEGLFEDQPFPEQIAVPPLEIWDESIGETGSPRITRRQFGTRQLSSDWEEERGRSERDQGAVDPLRRDRPRGTGEGMQVFPTGYRDYFQNYGRYYSR